MSYPGWRGHFHWARFAPRAVERREPERVWAATQWQREALSARDIMTWHVRTLGPQSTLKEAAQIMRDENVGIVPVVDQSGRLFGVLTDRDMVVRVFAEDRLPSQVRPGRDERRRGSGGRTRRCGTSSS